MSSDGKIAQDFHYEMGFRLKRIRQTKKVSQKQLAEMIGIAKQTVQKYETGEIKMSVDLIYLLSKFFKVPVGYFYGEGGFERNNNIGVIIASEIMKLPNENIAKAIYVLVKAINLSLGKTRG